MAKNQIAECTACGKGFAARPHKANLYCGLPCYRTAQRSGKYKRPAQESVNAAPCGYCGETVARTPSKCRDGAKSETVYCSRDCYDASRAEIIKARQTPCPVCEKLFDSIGGRKYCSHNCRVAAKKPAAVNCVNCGCRFSAVAWVPDRGRFTAVSGRKTCSDECATAWLSNNQDRKDKIGAAFKGDKHPNWQGGKSALNNKCNRGPNWKEQRSKAVRRDKGRCVDCGMSAEQCKERFGRDLDVDHIEPFHNFTSYKMANRLANLKSVCASCHRIGEAKRRGVQMVLSLGGHRSGHKGSAKGERVNTAKLNAVQVLRMRKESGEGASLSVLAKAYGISKSSAHQIVTKKSWRHI